MHTSWRSNSDIACATRADGRGRARLISNGIETTPAVRHAPPLTHGPNSPTLKHVIGALCAATLSGNKVAHWLTAIAFGLVILTGNTISAGDRADGTGRVRLISNGIETTPAV
ncbi:hypothetical protein F511_21409 [Dorcoceras hygrometricum]|uniref:Uncharacterized protein n=1 Tax=Dorcoceras hygrometricum TaxID=472368 RepID=A0A2Z7BQV9_9LAMI|nr:hypothetical protein F511_21409 [Dorcoceras hygrometricum]